MNSLQLRYVREFSVLSIETFQHTFFHVIDTLKVRGMARNMKSDVSGYFANKVQTKPLISGVISGFLGAFFGSVTFLATYNTLTNLFYFDPRFTDWDFRLKNFIIFVSSDFSASFARILFEGRKQALQMCQYDVSVPQIAKAAYAGWFALAARDVCFRTLMLGCFYGTTYVEHQPRLRYSAQETQLFLK